MVGLQEIHSLIKTLKTTRNFWDALTLIRSKGRKTIIFRDGSIFRLTWFEYWNIRDCISTGCKVEKVGEDLFRIRDEKLNILGSLPMLTSFSQQQLGIYACDCFNKVVLDIGGYQGETAVFFSRMGAKKVVIYEPVVSHHELIKRNMLLNGVTAELHEEGIGNVDGTQTIHYETTGIGFGTLSKGQYDMEIKVRNVASVLEESHADVAKLDCEGAEDSLVNVPSEVIRKIDLYIVEVHTDKTREAIIRKFNNSGFSLVNEIVVDKRACISVIQFKKNCFEIAQKKE